MKKVLFALVSLLAISSYAYGETQQQEQQQQAAAEISPLLEFYLTDGREILVSDQNLTVYTFDNDLTSDSTCYDACAKAWPPVLVPAGATLGSDMGVTVRKDGAQQLTYDGHPVYFFVGDSASGEINGDGLGNVWHIIIAE